MTTTTFSRFLANEMHKVQYSYSNTQVMLPTALAKQIISWGKKHVPDKAIYIDPADKGLGREDEIHTTVLYGLHTEKFAPVDAILRQQKPFACQLGKMSLFTTNPNYDVLKVEVKGAGLRRCNQAMQDKLKVTNNYSIYRPHVTIAYVKKGLADKFAGDKTFDGATFKANEIVFSSSNGKKTKIRLGVA